VKKTISIFIICLAQVYLAQNKEALVAKLNNTKQDSVKSNILNELSKDAIKNGSSEGKLYAKQAQVISEKISYIHGMANAYSNLGYCYLLENNYDSALFYFNKGIVKTTNTNHKSINSELLNRKAAVFYYTGITDSSLWYFKKALNQYEALKDSNAVIKSLNNIGAISLRTGDMDGAIVCFFKCLSYDEKQKNKMAIAMDCNNIGIILTDKKDYTSALSYLQKALQIKKENKDTLEILKTSINIANVYYQKKEYPNSISQYLQALKLGNNIKKYADEYSQITNNLGECYSSIGEYNIAMNYLNASLEIKQKLGKKSGLAATLGNIGQVYYRQLNYQKAIVYYTESNKLAIETSDIQFQKNAQQILVVCYLNLNQKEKALDAFSKVTLLQDSLFNETSAKQISETQIKYETEKKETENKLLQQQNNIKTLENENNNQKLKVQTQTIFILIACIVIATIIVLWQISLARIKKQKRALEIEKKLQQDRERISRDLHDNVGGQLSYVMFSLEGNEESSSDKRKEKAHNLANALRSVTSNLRETIWALNQEKLTVQDISDKLKTYARNIFAYSDTKIKFEDHIENDETLNPAFALNLFRICQEVINNVFKHAKASELTIIITKNKTTTIVITDNGVGFTKELASMESYGLTNLKVRADEINATLSIESEIHKGTKISIIV
jgi:signal transduction histidine kinase